VHEAIQQLPVEFREIILLREYEELSYQEIAVVLGCPAGTVMSRLEALDRDFECCFPTPRRLAIDERRNRANEPLR
jgi:hypothetical protein